MPVLLEGRELGLSQWSRVYCIPNCVLTSLYVRKQLQVLEAVIISMNGKVPLFQCPESKKTSSTKFRTS